MGLKERLAGTHNRDAHVAKALNEARANAHRGLPEFTITVHSTDGGAALLPRLVPFVVDRLQEQGFRVVNVSTDEWAYNAHLTVRTA
jgi:hypothetical protein